MPPSSVVVPQLPQLLPNQIKTLQKSLTFINFNTLPGQLVNQDYKYFLLWQPWINSSKTKIVKKPVTGKNWQRSNHLSSYPEILKKYELYHDKNNIPKSTTYDRQEINDHGWPHDIHTPPLGIGFMYTEDHPFICIDIDAQTPSNNRLYEKLNSYTEWSPSSKGLHIIVQTKTLLDKEKLIDIICPLKGKRHNKSEHRDLFISSGYVTLTGRLFNVPNYVTDIRVMSFKELEPILHEYYLSNISTLPTSYDIPEYVDQATETTKLVNAKQSSQGKARAKKQQQNKPLNTAQVKVLLDSLPVQCLTDDTFENLNNPDRSAVLDLSCTTEARDPWLIVGQALHHNFNGHMLGYSLWQEWSSLGTKYDPVDLETVWRSFSTPSTDQEDEEGNTARNITIATLIKLHKAQQPEFPNKNAKGVIESSSSNFYAYCAHYGITFQLNARSYEIDVTIPMERAKVWSNGVLRPEHYKQESLECIGTTISSDLKLHGAKSYKTRNLVQYMLPLARKYSYDPIKDYFDSAFANWDGQDRLGPLLDTITIDAVHGVTRKDYKLAVTQFIRKWLLQIVAAAYQNEQNRYRLDKLIIFVGPQSIGKTNWVASLFPKEIAEYCSADKQLAISNFRQDQVKTQLEFAGFLIINFNEIDIAFQPKNFSTFKATLDATYDKIWPPYGHGTIKMLRHTVFCGSTNSSRFLTDPTGNRRFEIIHCKDLDYKHTIDIKQLWGQACSIFKSGEKHYFDHDIPKDAYIQNIRDRVNRAGTSIDDEFLEDLLKEIYDADANRMLWTNLTFREIREMICEYTGQNFKENTRIYSKQKKTLESWLRSQHPEGKDEYSFGKGNNPKKYYRMPPRKTVTDYINVKAMNAAPMFQAQVSAEQVNSDPKQLDPLLDKAD